MPTRPTDKGRSSDFNNSSDTFSTFEVFSQNVVNTRDALASNTKELKENTESIDQSTAILKKMIASFSKVSGDFSSSTEVFDKSFTKSVDRNKNNLQDAIVDAEKLFERSGKNLDSTLTRGQKIGGTLISTMQVVGKRLINEYTNAADRVARTYKDQFSNITVRMQMTESDYSDMFNAASKSFREQDLSKQFSPVDYADSLATVLETGLRGDEASRQAYQNLIANKLIPAISTNTVAYRRMGKEFGDAFTQNTVAISKYTEAIYGAEGLEEGKLNNVIESLRTSLVYAVSQGEMTDEQAMESLNKFITGIQAMESAGVNTDDLVSNVQAILEGDISSISNMMRYAGVEDASDLLNTMSRDVFELFERYTEAYNMNGSSLASQNQQVSALGGDVTTGMQVKAATDSGKLDWNQVRDVWSEFDSSEEYNKQMNNLQDGMYQSADAAADKVTENLATSYGVFQSEIPRFQEMATDVQSILTAVVAILAKDTLGDTLSKNNGGLLSKFLGGGKTKSTTSTVTKGLSTVDKVDDIFFDLTSKSAVTSGGHSAWNSLLTKVPGVSSKASSIASGALTVALPALGGGIAIGDIISSYKNSREEGSDVISAAGEGLLSGLTGVNDTPEDVGDIFTGVLKNTAKGALIGAVGGPLGAAIGGAVGLTGNLIHALAEYNSEEEVHRRNLEESAEQLKKSSEALSTYSTEIDKYSSAENALSELKQNSSKDSVSYKKALSELKSVFPDYLKNLNEDSEVTSGQITILEKLIDLKKQQAALDAANALAEVDTEQIINNMIEADKINSEVDKESSAESNVQGILNGIEEWGKTHGATEIRFDEQGRNLEGYVDSEGNLITEGEAYDQLFTMFQGLRLGVDDAAKYDKEFKTTNYAGVISAAGSGMDITSESVDSEGIERVIGVAPSIHYEDALVNTESKRDVDSYIQGENHLQNNIGILATAASDEFKPYHKSGVLDALKRISLYVDEGRIGTGDSALMSQEDLRDSVGASAQEFVDQYKLSSDYAKLFKTGAYDIQSDNTPAILHQGEMVLTSTNANMLRNLGSGGISSLLQGLTLVSNNSQTTTAKETTTPSSAVQQEQVDTIVSVLNSIFEILLKMNPKASVSSDNSTTQLSENLIKFVGI